MALELQVTKDFVEMTDGLIAIAAAKQLSFENGNVLLVKVPIKNLSEIAIVQGRYMQDQVYQSGLARVIAAPRLLDPSRDARFKAGDIVIYNHAAKYTMSSLVVSYLFGIKLNDSHPIDYIEEYNNMPVVTVTDPDIMAVIPKEAIEIK